mmetsp:Transcript_3342/g.9510  ORF Transcript_3342/g.9510 Transcript_3342/m.9510 type:complete len:247 (+) Transcript_3342:831-1571(+)
MKRTMCCDTFKAIMMSLASSSQHWEAEAPQHLLCQPEKARPIFNGPPRSKGWVCHLEFSSKSLFHISATPCAAHLGICKTPYASCYSPSCTNLIAKCMTICSNARWSHSSAFRGFSLGFPTMSETPNWSNDYLMHSWYRTHYCQYMSLSLWSCILTTDNGFYPQNAILHHCTTYWQAYRAILVQWVGSYVWDQTDSKGMFRTTKTKMTTTASVPTAASMEMHQQEGLLQPSPQIKNSQSYRAQTTA